MRSSRGAVALLVALLVLAACGCAEKKKKARAAKAEAPIVPAEVDLDAAVPVDEGRITVAPPVGWKREPRSKDYVARYLPGGGRTFPSVTVIGGDPPAGITAVTEENHDEFVAAVAAGLADQFTNAEGKSTLIRKPAAVEVGPHQAVAWTAPGTAKVDGISRPIERSCTAVVVAGRMYTIEARAPKGKLDDDGRAAGRGVAAAIAVVESEPEPEPEEPAGEPAEPAAEPAEPAPEPAAEPAAAAAE